MKRSAWYQVSRLLWIVGGPTISYLMILGVAVGNAMTRPYGGLTKHEELSMHFLMCFSAIAALIGILGLIGTRYRWIRTTGWLLLFVVVPILLALHLNYTWSSSGPVHRLDASYITGLILSWMAVIGLWESTCQLGRRQSTSLA